MKKLDTYESDLLANFETGELKSTLPSKSDLAQFKAHQSQS